MTQSKQMPAPTGRVWNTPRIVRIGTIADVAGAAVNTTQNKNNS